MSARASAAATSVATMATRVERDCLRRAIVCWACIGVPPAFWADRIAVAVRKLGGPGTSLLAGKTPFQVPISVPIFALKITGHMGTELKKGPSSSLSRRELEVAALVAEGLTNRA